MNPEGAIPPEPFLNAGCTSMNRFLSALIVSLAVTIGSGASPNTAAGQAAGSTPAGEAALSDPEPWRINAAPYAWAINVSGNVTVRNQTLDTNASILDLLQKSDSLAGFMGYFKANKGRVSRGRLLQPTAMLGNSAAIRSQPSWGFAPWA